MVGKSFIGLAVLALAGFVQAQPHRHNHRALHENKAFPNRLEKKDVVWVTVTRTTTVNYVPTATTQPTQSPQQEVAEVADQPSNPPVLVAPPTEEKKVKASGGGTDGGKQGVSGIKGIVYSAKNDDGSCKGADAVKQEISRLSEYNMIRYYGPECKQTKLFLDNSDKMLFAGIWNVDNYDSAMKDLEIIAGEVDGRWNRIHTISVGNELVNFNKKSASDLRDLVSKVRTTLRDTYGYQGNVVTTDTLEATKRSKDLCDCGDYIAVNSHPFFDPNMVAGRSGDFLVEQIQVLKDFCANGKEVLITETGWPKDGKPGPSWPEGRRPSRPNQKAAISAIKEKLGDKYILLSAYDEPWKGPGSGEQAMAEAHWGVLDA